MWKEILRAALLGTDHTALPEETIQQLTTLGVDVDGEPSEMLLTAAAVVAPLRRAGFLTAEWKGAFPTSAPPDARAVCNDPAAACLSGILWGKYRRCLPEFMEYCRKRGKKIPPEMAPRLFNLILEDQEALPFFVPVMDEREKWLIKQNPEWNSLKKKISVAASAGESDSRQTPVMSMKEALATARRLAQIRELTKFFIQPPMPTLAEFQIFARECPPDAFEAVADIFGKIDDHYSRGWANDALDVLHFRKQMKAAFEIPGAPLKTA